MLGLLRQGTPDRDSPVSRLRRVVDKIMERQATFCAGNTQWLLFSREEELMMSWSAHIG